MTKPISDPPTIAWWVPLMFSTIHNEITGEPQQYSPEGMIGLLAVFDTREAAAKWAPDKPIIELAVEAGEATTAALNPGRKNNNEGRKR